MARVHVYCPAKTNGPQNSYARSEFDRLIRAAQADRIGRHELVAGPKDADVILFVGPEHATFQDIRQHPIRRRYIENSFLFYSGDRIVPLMPGLYASLRRKDYDPAWAISGFYPRVAENENIRDLGSIDNCSWLYAFSGAIKNHPVRARVVGLRHPRGLVKDTSSIPNPQRQRDGLLSPHDSYITNYIHVLRTTKFILCPRGIGTSSWRIFETIKAGRVPVIISDDWFPPPGPDWGKFSIRVAERDVEQIPNLLESIEPEAPALARTAVQAWDGYYSKYTMFHTIVEGCLAIKSRRKIPIRVRALPYYAATLNPNFIRHWFLSDLKRNLMRTIKWTRFE